MKKSVQPEDICVIVEGNHLVMVPQPKQLYLSDKIIDNVNNHHLGANGASQKKSEKCRMLEVAINKIMDHLNEMHFILFFVNVVFATTFRSKWNSDSDL